MKIKIMLLLVSLLALVNVKAEVDIHFFYSESCPHCKEAEKYFDKIENKYDFNIIAYETSKNKDNGTLLKEVADIFGDKINKVKVEYYDNENNLIILENNTIKLLNNNQTFSKGDFTNLQSISLNGENKKTYKRLIKLAFKD